MKLKQSENRLYYYVLEGSRLLLADERDKQLLVQILTDLYELKEWKTYVFCVTDNKLYLMTEAPDQCCLIKTANDAAAAFLSLPRNWPAGPDSVEKKLFVTACDEIDSLEQYHQKKWEIHNIPLKENYVQDLNDYWWSSYMSYAGCFNWRLVSHRAKLDSELETRSAV